MDSGVDGEGLRLRGAAPFPAAAGAADLDRARRSKQKARRAFWWRQFYTWHWISAAIALVGMILFALTGITLNHAAQIEARPDVVTAKATLPQDLLASVGKDKSAGKRPLPEAVARWIESRLPAKVSGREAEWSEGEIYVALPRPGGDAWLSVDRETGDVVHEATDRGWISYLNDLHKGRHTGAAWSWFLDVFAVACVVFCLTGLLLLQLHSGHRPMTWPTVAAGLVIPVVLAVLFIH